MACDWPHAGASVTYRKARRIARPLVSVLDLSVTTRRLIPFHSHDRAWSARDPGIARLLYDPFVLYKHDPRFAALCRKVGVPVPD